MSKKPLGRKIYESIGHLPNSGLGLGDHSVTSSQEKICCKKHRDCGDTTIVQEKLDGSCCAVVRINYDIVPLIRSGYRAESSPYRQHTLFANWVMRNRSRFMRLLVVGERVVGEWMIQAHGTLYTLPHEPFVPFDIMKESTRVTYPDFFPRVVSEGFTVPKLISYGLPISVDNVIKRLINSGHGSVGLPEGAVWRVEREGKVDFLAKWVRLDKVDGCFLPEISGQDPIWNCNIGKL